MKKKMIYFQICLILTVMSVSQMCQAQQNNPVKSSEQGAAVIESPDQKKDEKKDEKKDDTPKATDLRIVAVGDGFRLTESEVDALIEFAGKKNIRTTDEEYRKGAVKLKLFALEAKRLGLGDSKDALISTGDDMTVEEMMKYQGRYFYVLYEGANISEAAIRSYYLAHPKTFRKEEEKKDAEDTEDPSSAQAKESAKEPDDGFTGKEEMIPLDEEVTRKIRLTLVRGKWNEIQENAYKELVDKYHVRFCSSKEKCE